MLMRGSCKCSAALTQNLVIFCCLKSFQICKTMWFWSWLTSFFTNLTDSLVSIQKTFSRWFFYFSFVKVSIKIYLPSISSMLIWKLNKLPKTPNDCEDSPFKLNMKGTVRWIYRLTFFFWRLFVTWVNEDTKM